MTGCKDSLKGRGWRLPAKHMEQIVLQAIRNHLSGPRTSCMEPHAQLETLTRLEELQEAVPDRLFAMLSRVSINEGALTLTLDSKVLSKELKTDTSHLNVDLMCFDVPFTQKRRGVETRLVLASASPQKDQTLIANIARALDWEDRVKRGETLDDIAHAHPTTKKRVQQMLEYAFLAPDIVRDILAGTQPSGLTSTWVTTHAIPSDWSKQRALISTL